MFYISNLDQPGIEFRRRFDSFKKQKLHIEILSNHVSPMFKNNFALAKDSLFYNSIDLLEVASTVYKSLMLKQKDGSLLTAEPLEAGNLLRQSSYLTDCRSD